MGIGKCAIGRKLSMRLLARSTAHMPARSIAMHDRTANADNEDVDGRKWNDRRVWVFSSRPIEDTMNEGSERLV